MDNSINTCPVPNEASGQIFMNLLAMLLTTQCALNTRETYPPDYGPNLKDGDTYDFIVVGAGSAGSVVASRLSENKNWKVLLVEAGGYPSPTSEVPGLYIDTLNTAEDWAYRTEKTEQACLGFEDQRCRWPRGKVLGGTSTINGLLYMRGNPHDYDSWVLQGNPGWDYLSVLAYFLKSENAQSPELLLSPLHACYGNWSTVKSYTLDPVAEVIKLSAAGLGYTFYDDEVNLGYFSALQNIENGTRCSTAKAFLAKIGNRENLHVALNAQVGRVFFSDDNKNATGIEVRIGENTVRINAGKEVVLSAGTINSPQILMNSGVGPKEHLEATGIKMVKDLKVGENLQDHVFFLGTSVKIDDHLVHQGNVRDELYEYFARRKGPLAGISINPLVGLVNTLWDSPIPDIQLLHDLTRKNDILAYNVKANAFGFNEDVRKAHLGFLEKSHVLTIAIQVTKPKSRGKILLGGADPYQVPLIQPNYLSDEWGDDRNTLIRGIDFIHKLIASPFFQRHGAEILKVDLPACKNFTDTTDYYKCSIRHLSTTGYNPVGTCKMGPEEDKTSVVDWKLKVHGINGLRVIDASIMPTIISVNINAAVVMIGEKGADLIKQDWIVDK